MASFCDLWIHFLNVLNFRFSLHRLISSLLSKKVLLVLLQEHQHEVDREALKQERKRRRELERRLADEMKKHNELMEQTIKLREKKTTSVTQQVLD